MSKGKKRKKPAAPKMEKEQPDTFQGSNQSAYGDDKAICRNAKCKLRKASCVGFIACPGFKG